MYLKRIETVGFKSFAEKMNIVFEKGITGIVGPNGSGKSNIVDAIRWVLGEQSVKQLRGAEGMADVIFSGSSSRKALNHASVTLVLDNTDNYLPIEFSEVSITRRVFRTGESEYLINNEKCRMKDITDLIMDSGLSKEAFNIISQGRVQEIISAKPEERRMIFEEAAGVLKYRKRKESALRKLKRTDENIDRANDIIYELEHQIEPLRIQSEKAEKYLAKKKELEDVEIALIAHDIKENNKVYKDSKEAIEKLNDSIASRQVEVTNLESSILTIKNEISNIDSKVTEINTELMDTSKLVEEITIKKTVLEERRKYSDNKDAFMNEQIKLKEDMLKLQNEIVLANSKLSNYKNDHKTLCEIISNTESNIEDKIKLIKNHENLIKALIGEKEEHIAKINVYESTNENRTNLIRSVKAIMENNDLSGIIDVFASLINVDKSHSKAIETTLGNSMQFIVCETAKDAQSAIDYLKKNRIGRATFLPLDKVTIKNIKQDVIDLICDHKGFVGVASKLVSFDERYQDVVDNQLGNVIIADDLTSARDIADLIKFRFKVVTLDGEVIHPGGSITGGETKHRKYGLLTSKFDIEQSKDRIKKIQSEREDCENNLISEKEAIQKLNTELSTNRVKKLQIEESINQLNSEILNSNSQLKLLNSDINSVNDILNDKVDSSEDAQILNELYQAQALRDDLIMKQKNMRAIRMDKTNKLGDLELELRSVTQVMNNELRQEKDAEVKFSRADVLLDRLLNTLSEEYNMTFEYAYENYELSIELTEARAKVKVLKDAIRRIGHVNLDAREEYINVKERYDFLIEQRHDLLTAKENLLDTIKEMDEVMVTKFSDTFYQIKAEFKKNFKKLFAGGNADLQLTDEENMLETGIEIISEPPGKKLQHLSLLSGGEKSLATLALLFSILRVRPVPFCILDEAEAALDEANLVRFAEFLKEFSISTQFIVITHRKTTMENSESLYGVTMQESGVTKLVSVKFSETDDYVKNEE